MVNVGYLTCPQIVQKKKDEQNDGGTVALSMGQYENWKSMERSRERGSDFALLVYSPAQSHAEGLK